MNPKDAIQQQLDQIIEACLILDGPALIARNRELLQLGPRLSFTEKGREHGCFVQLRHPTRETAFESHTHEFFEISFILEGKGQHQSGDFRHPVKRGDLFFLNHQYPHRFIIPPGERLAVLNFQFLPEFLECTVTLEKLEAGLKFMLADPFLRSQGDSAAPLHLEGGELIRLAASALLILDEFNRSWPKPSEILRPMFKCFITQVTRCYAARFLERPGYLDREQAIFKDLLAFIDVRLKGPLSISEIASAAGLGRTRLAEFFREKQGTSVVDYIRRRRISHGKELLAQTNMPVIEIALETGFSDLSNFNRAFKAFNGVTPSHFRKDAQKSKGPGQ